MKLTRFMLFRIFGEAGGVNETSFLIFLLLSITEKAIEEKWGLLLCWADTLRRALVHSSLGLVESLKQN